MAVRHDQEARTDRSVADQDRPVIVFDVASARPSRLARPLRLVVLLLTVAGIGAGSWWMTTGSDEQVTARPAAGAPAPAAIAVPGGLALHVAPPATVVAGQAARFRVSYTDAEGIFGGSLEDWGDIGVGSMKEAACRAGAPVAAALQDSYVATHTWRRPGSYPVSIAVTTYTCSDGRATEETQKAQLTVVVDAR